MTEEIDQGNEIVLSKVGRGNKLRKIRIKKVKVIKNDVKEKKLSEKINLVCVKKGAGAKIYGKIKMV